MAALGLYKHDVGADAEARDLLEAVLKAGVVRPIAYFALAQLRFAEAEAHPAAADDDFSLNQTMAILAPLAVARRQAPLTAEAYGLIAEDWKRCAIKPIAANLAVLREGVQLYPRSTRLAYVAASVNAQWGYASEANEFIDLGLKFADEDMTSRFEHLRESLSVSQ